MNTRFGDIRPCRAGKGEALLMGDLPDVGRGTRPTWGRGSIWLRQPPAQLAPDRSPSRRARRRPPVGEQEQEAGAPASDRTGRLPPAAVVGRGSAVIEVSGGEQLRVAVTSSGGGQLIPSATVRAPAPAIFGCRGRRVAGTGPARLSTAAGSASTPSSSCLPGPCTRTSGVRRRSSDLPAPYPAPDRHEACPVR